MNRGAVRDTEAPAFACPSASCLESHGVRTDWLVLIADDEPAARRGVRQLLSSHAGFIVAGECRNGAEARRALDDLAPDVLFLDIQMPDLDGFEVIGRRGPDRGPLVVFLTAYEEHALRAFDAG